MICRHKAGLPPGFVFFYEKMHGKFIKFYVLNTKRVRSFTGVHRTGLFC